MIINGVSARKIEKVTEELSGKSFSKSIVSELCKKLDPVVKPLRTDRLTLFRSKYVKTVVFNQEVC